MAGQTSERPSLSALWRPALVGGSAAVLLYAALLAFLSHSTFPVAVHSGAHWPWLMDKPVGEDGYYMLTVADNIASRGKILYNWGIPATGIQPLVTVLFAGLDFGPCSCSAVPCFSFLLVRCGASLCHCAVRRWRSLRERWRFC